VNDETRSDRSPCPDPEVLAAFVAGTLRGEELQDVLRHMFGYAGTVEDLEDARRRLACPTEETIGAFADGRLTGRARTEVIEHIAWCAECRDQVLVAGEFAATEPREAWKRWSRVPGWVRTLTGLLRKW
jgi:hypothetical protein